MKKDNSIVPSASISPDGDNLGVPCAAINLGDQNICYIKQREDEIVKQREDEIADLLRGLVGAMCWRLTHQQYMNDVEPEIRKLAKGLAHK